MPTAAKLKELLRSALESGVLVLKDADQGTAVVPSSMTEVERFLEAKVDLARVILPKTTKNLTYVRQLHVRQRSVHEDFRFDLGGGRVWGFTVTMPFGVSKETWAKIQKEIDKAATAVLGKAPRSWKDVPESKLYAIRSRLPGSRIRRWLEDDLLDRWLEDWVDWKNKHVCEAKALQDTSWKAIDWRIFVPGGMGATSNGWGFMFAFDRGKFAWGVSKPDYREFFLESDRGLYTGRLNVLWLPREKAIASLRGEEAKEKLGGKPWVGYLFTTREQQPYVSTQRSIQTEFVPPKGMSCLPPPVEQLVPKDLRFWQKSDRKATHREFVQWAKENLEWYERSSPSDWPKSWKEMVRRKT